MICESRLAYRLPQGDLTSPTDSRVALNFFSSFHPSCFRTIDTTLAYTTPRRRSSHAQLPSVRVLGQLLVVLASLWLIETKRVESEGLMVFGRIELHGELGSARGGGLRLGVAEMEVVR